MSTEAESPVAKENNPNDDINILLVGETGVGKSTFINAFANYVTYKYFDKVNKDNLHILIPSVFSIPDKNNVVHKVSISSSQSDDRNEFLETGASATQGIKSYVFDVYDGKAKVRLIDTPGTGDTKGIQQDEINCQNIVTYIKHLGKLNGICFMFKPNQSRLTAHFEYCIWQILSRLDRAACKNIVYVFTNTSADGFHPGDTLGLLWKILNDVKQSNNDNDKGVVHGGGENNHLVDDLSIDLNRNVFCFDNECFKYLAALKNNVEFDGKARERYRKSWETSAKTCWSFLKYLNNHPLNKLQPYIPNNLMAVNMARNVITKLAPTLHDLSQLLDSSTTALEFMRQSRDDLINESQQLKSKLKLVTDVEKNNLPKPQMVCASIKCSKVYKVGDEKKWHYPSICHRDCVEIGLIDHEVIGNPALANCSAIDPLTRQCCQCQCDFSLHMVINYETKLVDSYEPDGVNDELIKEKDENVKEYMNKIQLVNAKNKQLTSERKSIMGFCTQLAMFLKKYALTLVNPSYKEYILYLINLKKLSHDTNDGELKELERLLGAYEQTKMLFDEVTKTQVPITWNTNNAEGYIEQRIRNLFDLAITGADILKLFKEQATNNVNDGIEEYIHSVIFRKKKSATNTNKVNAAVGQKKGAEKKQSKMAESKTDQQATDAESDDSEEEDQEKVKNVTKNKGKNQSSANKDDKKARNNPQQSKKKHVNNNKANKDLKDLTVDELRKLLDEKVRLEKVQKKSTTNTNKGPNQNKKSNAQASSSSSSTSSSRQQFDRRTPPPPYQPDDNSSGNNRNFNGPPPPPPVYMPHNYPPNQPQWSGYSPNQVPPTSATNVSNSGPNKKTNNNNNSDETIEIRVRIPKEQLHNQQQPIGAPQYHPQQQQQHYAPNPYYHPHPGAGAQPPLPPYQPQAAPLPPYYPQQAPFPPYGAAPFHPPAYNQQQQQYHQHAASGGAHAGPSSSKKNPQQQQQSRGGGTGGGGNKSSAAPGRGGGAKTQFKPQRRGKGGNNAGNKSDSSSNN